jgi:hypothetical protein
MKKNFYLFNKTYLGDFKRTQKLCKSIHIFNKDDIPLYISVPSADLEYFKENIREPNNIKWVSDESIVLSMPDKNLTKYHETHGYLSQQVVKSEFWRLVQKNASDDVSYLCLDSDSEFIRDFFISDFMNESGIPYTVIYQNKELLQMAHNKKINKVALHFHDDCQKIRKVFDRSGPDIDYGIPPVIWSSRVWQDLYHKYLEPRNMSFWDAIDQIPTELRWYGESLLKYQSIPLIPIEPLFRAYHYNWQFFTYQKMGESVDKLKAEYMGMVYQSNWFYELDYGEHAKRKSIPSRVLMYLKRFLARFR